MTVEKAAASSGATRVEAVGLRVGTLSGAEPVALTGAWPIASTGTVAQGAELVIEVVAAAVFCPACDKARPIDEFFDLTCPVCGTPTANLVAGREFEVTYADMDIPHPDT